MNVVSVVHEAAPLAWVWSTTLVIAADAGDVYPESLAPLTVNAGVVVPTTRSFAVPKASVIVIVPAVGEVVSTAIVTVEVVEVFPAMSVTTAWTRYVPSDWVPRVRAYRPPVVEVTAVPLSAKLPPLVPDATCNCTE